MITDDGRILTLTDDDRAALIAVTAHERHDARLALRPVLRSDDRRLRENQSLTPHQQSILTALGAGHATIRTIMDVTGISSTSVVAYNLRRLAELGLCVLEDRGGNQLKIYDGRDYALAWDLAARLAGNLDA